MNWRRYGHGLAIHGSMGLAGLAPAGLRYQHGLLLLLISGGDIVRRAREKAEGIMGRGGWGQQHPAYIVVTKSDDRFRTRNAGDVYSLHNCIRKTKPDSISRLFYYYL